MKSSGNWPPQQPNAASRNWETRTAQRRQRHSGWWMDEHARHMAGVVVVVLLLGIGLWFWSSRQTAVGQASEQTQTAPGALVAAPTRMPTAAPTTAPTPTPAVANATIVRLGGGPGMLHESPGFDTPVLTVILREGDVVELLGRDRQDSEGTTWVLVAFGDSVGWSPENNVELDS